MTIIKSILRRSDAAVGREIEDELRFHIEMRARDNVTAGMSSENAVAEAMRRFGDFDQIRSTCEEIRRERRAGFMNLAKGLAWIMFGCGLTLKLAARVDGLRIVGDYLSLIAILWRCLIFLREMRPNQQRIAISSNSGSASGQPALSVIHAIGDLSMDDFKEDQPRPVPAYDKDGRTPVERLISDEDSGDTTKSTTPSKR
ncbi:MAG: hypothetical protein J2P21_25545 [Chloracidobacterium sp.]|nr:hypothetical protein [Chloracidobacterium sp.]